MARIQRLVRPNHLPLRGKTLLAALALIVAVTGVMMRAERPVPSAGGKKIQEAVAAVSSVIAQTAKGEDLKAFVDSIESHHALVLDDNSGDVLLRKNADDVVPIASLTKLMTAMVVLDIKPDMDRLIRIDEADAGASKQNRSGVPIGTRLPLRELMRLALMSSDNRAAYALARSYPGGLPAFEKAVGAKIAALGLAHTTLNEPTGLSPFNTSTATDVAIMVNAAARYLEITRDTTYARDIVDINGKGVEYRNTNPFVGQDGWDIELSKTGFSNDAGSCLTMRVRSAGKNFTMVLLNARYATPAQDILNIRHLLLTGTAARKS